MSRAFVREPDGDIPAEPLPDIPVPPPPNPVTARGLAQIEASIADLERRLAGAASLESGEVERLRRELRYWTARHASARLTPPPAAPDEVGFGSRVTVDWPGRGRTTLEIVGEDESDPPAGRIGWRAPAAAALIGSGVGDAVEAVIGGRKVPLAILAVDNQPQPPDSGPAPTTPA